VVGCKFSCIPALKKSARKADTALKKSARKADNT